MTNAFQNMCLIIYLLLPDIGGRVPAVLDDSPQLHPLPDGVRVPCHLHRLSSGRVRHHRHRVVPRPLREDQERLSGVLNLGQPLFRPRLRLRHTRLIGSEPLVSRYYFLNIRSLFWSNVCGKEGKGGGPQEIVDSRI